MTIAGGIMGALFHRERTGEATIVDVSLLGTGLWAMGQAMALSLVLGHAVGGRRRTTSMAANPLSRNYETKDGRVPLRSPACRPASTGRRSARSSAGPSWPPTRASPTTRRSWPTAARRSRLLDRGLRRAPPLDEWRERLDDLRRPVGGRPGHARGGRRPADRRQRLPAGLRDRGRHAVPARRPRRCSSTSEPADARAGARVQRARRRDPRRARARLGHHRRPQGPRRRRLTRSHHRHRTDHIREEHRHDAVRRVPLRRQAGRSSSAAPPAWAPPPPSWSRTPAPRSWSWTSPRSRSPGAKAIHVNLAEKDSIDAAVDECGGPVDALFSCAGVADGTPGIEKINFIGHRHLIDRLLARRPAPAGRRHRLHLVGRRARAGRRTSTELKEYLATPDFDAAVDLDRGERRAPTTCRPSRRSAPTSPARPSRC